VGGRSPDAPTIAANAAKVLTGIAGAADQREPPTVAMAQQWHRDLYDGIDRPFDYYAGEVRDSDQSFPDLIGYEVQVGRVPGVPAAHVPQHCSASSRAPRRRRLGSTARSRSARTRRRWRPSSCTEC
jgi:hypothetical protein